VEATEESPTLPGAWAGFILVALSPRLGRRDVERDVATLEFIYRLCPQAFPKVKNGLRPTTESSRFAEHPAPKSNGDMDQTWAPLSYKNGRFLAILNRFVTGLALMLKLPEGLLRKDIVQACSALKVHACGAEQSSSGPILGKTTRPYASPLIPPQDVKKERSS
jgi:hypothetical protein